MSLPRLTLALVPALWLITGCDALGVTDKSGRSEKREDRSRDAEKPRKSKTTPRATASEATTSPSSSTSATSAPPAEKPLDETDLANLFTGGPAPGFEAARVTSGLREFALDTPKGWQVQGELGEPSEYGQVADFGFFSSRRGEEPFPSGASIIVSPKRTEVNTPQQQAFGCTYVGASGCKFEPAVSGKFGRAGLPARIARGRGKSALSDVTVYSVVAEIGDKHIARVYAMVGPEASEAHKLALFSALRSFDMVGKPSWE